MEDPTTLLAHERAERQRVTESQIVALLGEFIFRYSDFVTALHFCVAWHDWGATLDNYGDIADDLGTADLLARIRKQVQLKYGQDKVAFDKYSKWLMKANALRVVRNVIAHSRWKIEPYGRYGVAITTPVFVDPQIEQHFTVERLRELRESIHPLISELNKLRHTYYL